MNWEVLANSKLVENLGWALVDSVWQIGLLAFILFLVLRIFKNFSANARCLLATAALGLAFVLPLATFVQLTKDSSANRIPNQLYVEENAGLLKPEPLPSDNFFTSAGSKIAAANRGDKNAFSGFSNLQNRFKQNLAAALPMLVLLWIFGVAFFSFRLGGGFWQLHKYKTREISAPDDVWQTKFVDLCERFRIAQIVKLLQSNRIETPIVVGWLKPLILVPPSVFLQMNPQQLETILAHELVHIRRYDNLVNFAQSLVEILFFYHPCVWWISQVIRREREFACDDAVTETLENPHIVYASALANLEEIRRLTKEKIEKMPPVSMAATGGKLMQRINRILQKNTERQNPKQTLWSAASLAFVLISALLITVFWTDSPFDVNAQTKTGNKKMAVGFVSIPSNFNDKADETFDETAMLLIEKLTAHKIPAIGFVNGASISLEQNIGEQRKQIIELTNRINEKTISNSDASARIELLKERIATNMLILEKMFNNRADVVRMWRDAGLEVGIGNLRHVWFYDTPYDEYVAGVEKNDSAVREILAEKNLPLAFFSYPYLNTGKTTEDKNRFENWLTTRGLRSVKYTFDNQEWMYSFAYDNACEKNDAETAQRVKAEFLDYMTKMLAHYEAYSQEMFNRDIAQTLVLTPSRLVADSADVLFGTFEKHGYKFVSMDEAQSDKAYQTEEKFIDSKSGSSWFERWQLARGKKLRDEPRVSKSVAETWDNRSNNNPPPPPPKPPAPPIPPAPNKML